MHHNKIAAVWPNGKALDYDLHVIKRFQVCILNQICSSMLLTSHQVRPLARSIRRFFYLLMGLGGILVP
jgi:hypothetical protein